MCFIFILAWILNNDVAFLGHPLLFSFYWHYFELIIKWWFPGHPLLSHSICTPTHLSYRNEQGVMRAENFTWAPEPPETSNRDPFSSTTLFTDTLDLRRSENSSTGHCIRFDCVALSNQTCLGRALKKPKKHLINIQFVLVSSRVRRELILI